MIHQLNMQGKDKVQVAIWANEYEVYDWWIGKESNDDQGTR